MMTPTGLIIGFFVSVALANAALQTLFAILCPAFIPASRAKSEPQKRTRDVVARPE